MNIFKRLCCYILRDELAALKAYIVNQQDELKRLKLENKKDIQKMQDELAALADREFQEAVSGLISSLKLIGEKKNEYF